MPSNTTLSAMSHLYKNAVPLIVENFRHKRQLWHTYGYDNYYYGYGFQLSRIILIILILIALFLCCLIPCICAMGIWFAGWFGLRNQTINKGRINSSNPINTSTSPAPPPPPPPQQQQQQQQQPNIPQTNSVPSRIDSVPPGAHRDTYIYEEKRSDRYYNRPPSPCTFDECRRYFTSSKL